MRRIQFLLAAVLFIVASAANATCPAKNGEEWRQFIKQSQFEQITFFASWCGGCSGDLQAATDKTVLVAVFDEQKNAEKALKGLLKDKPVTCVFDAKGEIAKLYDVKGLPASRNLPK